MTPDEAAFLDALGAAEVGASLLAIDLGLRCGLAWYVRDSQTEVRLVRHRCTEFHTRTRLRAAVMGVLGEVPGLVGVVAEGDRGLWAIWEKGAAARGIGIACVSPERWRRGLWGASAPTSGKDAKAWALRVAEGDGRRGEEGLVGRFGARGATRMRTDAAEAVCLGFWAAREAGWHA
jgi:hypothetical protein